MIKLLYVSTLTMSLMFTLTSHPLSMGLVLLLQVSLISMITGLLAHNFWYSYILFMIMIGGMLVLFIYMTSVASNEKFLYSNKLTIIVLISIMIIILLMIIDSYPSYQMTTNLDALKTQNVLLTSLALSKYLNKPTNWILMMMIIYLLVTLIAVVKITNVTYGPLRQKF